MLATNLANTENEVTIAMTKRADDLLHMILDLKQDKEVDLYLMQTIVLNMYKDEIELLHIASELKLELDKKKKRTIEIPGFMTKKRV